MVALFVFEVFMRALFSLFRVAIFDAFIGLGVLYGVFRGILFIALIGILFGVFIEALFCVITGAMFGSFIEASFVVFVGALFVVFM